MIEIRRLTMTEKLNHPFIKKDNHDYVDYYLVVDDRDKYQLFKEHSSLYDCDEMVFIGQLKNNQTIKFVRGDDSKVPNLNSSNNISGPGVTFSGKKACEELVCKNILSCPIADSDLIYNFYQEGAHIVYVGEDSNVKLYIRVYDNFSGDENDRWLVISLEHI